MNTLNQVLKEVKSEFNSRKDEGCVILDNFISRFVGYPEDESELNKTANLIENVVKHLENARGVYFVDTIKQSYGQGYFSHKIITCVRLVRTPCKEYRQLQNYFNKYTTRILHWDDVKLQQISGKRNSYDVESEKLLMHDPKACTSILSWLRANKATTYEIDVSFHRHTERSEGYQYEREWNGYNDDYMLIKLYTKIGCKFKTKAEFHLY